MSRTDDRPWTTLTERELSALHDVEVGREWVRRAHGHLLAFHHAVGHGMDHFDDAEATLRAAGHPALADVIRDDLLPRGAVDDRWTYGLVESFEASMADPVGKYEQTLREDLADGERHLVERRQQARRRDRAQE